MNDSLRQLFLVELNSIYARLDQQDVEQFYAGYQLWSTQQLIAIIEEQIADLQRQIDANAAHLRAVQPTAVALATLARFQAHGVNDVDLLNRLLERGEEWLDLTMQRLDYCEELDFIHDNYTQWCEHALEGAYDWIDSMRDGPATATPSDDSASLTEAPPEAIEELLLRKLTSDEDTPPLASTPETLTDQATLESAAPDQELTPPIEADAAAVSPSVPPEVEAHDQSLPEPISDLEISAPVETDATASLVISAEHTAEPLGEDHAYSEFPADLETPSPVETDLATTSYGLFIPEQEQPAEQTSSDLSLEPATTPSPEPIIDEIQAPPDQSSELATASLPMAEPEAASSQAQTSEAEASTVEVASEEHLLDQPEVSSPAEAISSSETAAPPDSPAQDEGAQPASPMATTGDSPAAISTTEAALATPGVTDTSTQEAETQSTATGAEPATPTIAAETKFIETATEELQAEEPVETPVPVEIPVASAETAEEQPQAASPIAIQADDAEEDQDLEYDIAPEGSHSDIIEGEVLVLDDSQQTSITTEKEPSPQKLVRQSRRRFWQQLLTSRRHKN